MALQRDIRWLVGEPDGDQPIFILCPFHDDTDPSYAVYPDGTWCFVCRRRESPRAFAKRLQADLARLPEVQHEARRRKATEKEVAGWDVLCTVWHRTLIEGARKEAIHWFYERGLWHDTILRYRLGHTGERFSVPIIDEGTRRVVSYQLRLDPRYCDPDEPKYMNPKGSHGILHRPNPRGAPTVVCEGPLDALLLAQYGADPVTTVEGSGSLAPTLKDALPRHTRLVIATDQDEAGELAAQELRQLFPRAVRATWEGGKDIGEAVTNTPAIRRGTLLRTVLG